MIIKYPTGFYRDVLPQNPEDVGNVTFTISNSPPPRTNLVYPKISVGLVNRKRQVEVISIDERRQELGSLIFTISSAQRSDIGSNSRQYELGEVLEFTDNQGPAAEPMLVSSVTEIRHDTNVLDYAQMGLSDDEQNAIARSALNAQTTLTARLNELKQLRADSDVEINSIQKSINELTRTITALESVVASTQDQSVIALIEKLKVKRDAAFSQRQVTIEAADAYAAEAETVIAQLRSVAVVVK